MANNVTSNTTQKVMRVFLEAFEASRVVTKTIDTQLFRGRFTPQFGSTIDVKRSHDYNTIRTSGGDISGSTKSDIISGKASAIVQDYFTVATEWSNIEEALELDQLDRILAPMATKMITDLELDLGSFMQKNSGLVFGSPGTAVSKWSDVAGAGAFLQSVGVPQDMPWTYAMNPFATIALADVQGGLASGNNSLVDTAWERAKIARNFGGMMAITSNALPTRTSSDLSDRVGALTSAPAAGYVTAKDTMTQVWAVKNFGTTEDINVGDIIEVTGKFRLNMATREVILGADGNPLKWTATVVVGVTLVAGAGNITVTAPAIQETDGQYNSINVALATDDVLTILGTASQVLQPSLFYHPQAFTLATVKLPKLFSTDTVATTEDGFSIRVSKYSDGDANVQKIRFDLLPAFGAMNPHFAGQGYGQP